MSFVDGVFLYIEASAPRLNGDKAQLIGPSLTMNAGDAQCFSFWYNMLGDHIRAMNVYAKTGSALGSPIFTRTGTQGATWLQAQITISGPGPVQVRDYEWGFDF